MKWKLFETDKPNEGELIIRGVVKKNKVYPMYFLGRYAKHYDDKKDCVIEYDFNGFPLSHTLMSNDSYWLPVVELEVSWS